MKGLAGWQTHVPGFWCSFLLMGKTFEIMETMIGTINQKCKLSTATKGFWKMSIETNRGHYGFQLVLNGDLSPHKLQRKAARWNIWALPIGGTNVQYVAASSMWFSWFIFHSIWLLQKGIFESLTIHQIANKFVCTASKTFNINNLQRKITPPRNQYRKRTAVKITFIDNLTISTLYLNNKII